MSDVGLLCLSYEIDDRRWKCPKPLSSSKFQKFQKKSEKERKRDGDTRCTSYMERRS